MTLILRHRTIDIPFPGDRFRPLHHRCRLHRSSAFTDLNCVPGFRPTAETDALKADVMAGTEFSDGERKRQHFLGDCSGHIAIIGMGISPAVANPGK